MVIAFLVDDPIRTELVVSSSGGLSGQLSARPFGQIKAEVHQATLATNQRGFRYQPMSDQHAKVVAIGLLTESDLSILGKQFDRWYPVHDTPCFGELLAAIDEADRALSREHDKDPAK